MEDNTNNLPQDSSDSQKNKTGVKNSFLELVRFALITAIIVIPVRMFIAQPFIVSGASMDPTFYNGQYLIVDELSYRFEEPKRGEVIIFKFPKDTKKYLIKRIIGLPLETVIVENDAITVKNEETPSGFKLNEPYLEGQKNGQFQVTLGEEEYFVMGDNRMASSDSRAWGPLNKKFIVGRPFVRLFPLNRIDLFPGDARKVIEQ